MLKINTNNGGAVTFCALEENGKQYDGVMVKHLNRQNEDTKSNFIQGGDIITLLNIYTYATEKGYTLDTIASDLFDKIDELEQINLSIKALNNLTEQMKEEERSEK